jgi:hypothetical protein
MESEKVERTACPYKHLLGYDYLQYPECTDCFSRFLKDLCRYNKALEEVIGQDESSGWIYK